MYVSQTHLFIHHVLRFHLSRSQTREAVVFASHYQHLVYFAHALEILLHAVLEDEADSLPNSSLHLPPLQTALSISTGPKVPKNAVLPVVVDFLDQFSEALQVVVNCARKTEITRWAYLFQFVGKPRDLFEVRTVICNGNTRNLILYHLHSQDLYAEWPAEDCCFISSGLAQSRAFGAEQQSTSYSSSLVRSS